MVDPNQPRKFKSKKKGKIYIHRRRHQANERQIDLDIFKKSFEKRKKRKMEKDEFEVFKSAYGMGYKERVKRTKKIYEIKNDKDN